MRCASGVTPTRSPPSVALVLDGGGRAHVAGTVADLRFDAIPGTSGGYRVALAGSFATATSIGRCAATDVPAVAIALLDRFCHLRRDQAAAIRRVQHAVAAWGTTPFREAAGHLIEAGGDPGERPADPVIGHQPGAWYGAAFAFGRLDADTLQVLADAAERHGDGDLRILPTRAVLLSRAHADAGPMLRAAGAIEEPGDPHLRAETCSGCGGCERGTTATLSDTRTLVASAPTLLAAGTGAVLHVSGCAKGCAHSGAAAVTLTGRAGRYDLSIGGAAGSAPLWRDLDVAAAASRLTALEREFLRQRSGDEDPAATLGRLDPDWLRNRIDEEVAGA
ncbi:MAG: hypothetical protein U5K73_01085 [Halofilum sp. (in: g-proteobacteria)]|nr:hypothetical protein [Halofilum sp. (in: g-proteobacteria)]